MVGIGEDLLDASHLSFLVVKKKSCNSRHSCHEARSASPRRADSRS